MQKSIASAIAGALNGQYGDSNVSSAKESGLPVFSPIHLKDKPVRPSPAGKTNRRKLWQLETKYHCALLGACLDVTDMYTLAEKLGLQSGKEITDYQLHSQMVHLAAIGDQYGRRLNRYLESKFTAQIRHFNSFKTVEELATAWEKVQEHGDLGGAFWALVTHPKATDSLAGHALGQVHMISHISATAIREIARENKKLKARLAEKDSSIDRERSARHKLEARLSLLEKNLSERDALSLELKGIRRQLSQRILYGSQNHCCGNVPKENAEYQTLKSRVKAAEEDAREWRKLYRRARKASELRYGNQSAEASLENLPPSDTPVNNLGGLVIGYVGGRNNIVPKLRSLTEQNNGRFIHHDGGISDRPGRLDENLKGTDVLVVPVDCVSHDAAYRLKRHSRRSGKSIYWLHTASVSSYQAVVERILGDHLLPQ